MAVDAEELTFRKLSLANLSPTHKCIACRQLLFRRVDMGDLQIAR